MCFKVRSCLLSWTEISGTMTGSVAAAMRKSLTKRVWRRTPAYALCALRDGISGYRIQELVDAGCHRYLNSRDIREVDSSSIQPVEKLLLYG